MPYKSHLERLNALPDLGEQVLRAAIYDCERRFDPGNTKDALPHPIVAFVGDQQWAYDAFDAFGNGSWRMSIFCDDLEDDEEHALQVALGRTIIETWTAASEVDDSIPRLGLLLSPQQWADICADPPCALDVRVFVQAPECTPDVCGTDLARAEPEGV